jgi:uncharacterized membrane protein
MNEPKPPKDPNDTGNEGAAVLEAWGLRNADGSPLTPEQRAAFEAQINADAADATPEEKEADAKRHAALEALDAHPLGNVAADLKHFLTTAPEAELASLFEDKASMMLSIRNVYKALEMVRELEAQARAEFLNERIAELPPAERPTPEERADLERRLLAAVDAVRWTYDETGAARHGGGEPWKTQCDAEGKPLVSFGPVMVDLTSAVLDKCAETNKVLAREIAALWTVFEAAARKETAPEGDLVRIGKLPGGPVLLKRAPSEAQALAAEQAQRPPEYLAPADNDNAGVLELHPFPKVRTYAALDEIQVALTPEIMIGDYRVTLAYAWLGVLSEWRTTNAERLAARAVLFDESDDPAEVPEAEGCLAQAVLGLMPDARAAVRVATDLPGLGEREGMFALDADLADFIASQAIPGAKEAAEGWRKKWRADWAQQNTPGEEHWGRWVDPLRLPRVLARVLWPLKVRPDLERERNRRDSAGVVAPVLTSLVETARVGLAGARHGAQVDWVENSARILDKNGRAVGELRVQGPTVDGRVIKLAALGTLAAQRVLRWAIWEGYEKRFIRADPEFSVLTVEGGEGTLAAQFGLKGRKAANSLREAFDAWSAVWIDTPKGYGRIFAAYHHKPAPGRAARLEVHLLGPLRPGYVNDELALHRHAEDKRIVPVPMPEQLPPLVGRENEGAPQAQLQLLTLREFRTRAEELAQRGAVEISEKRWRELAEEAALPLRLLADVLNAFSTGRGTTPAPPFLTRSGRNDFGLADAYKRERTAILSAAGKVKRGRAAGRKRVARQEKAGRQRGHQQR